LVRVVPARLTLVGVGAMNSPRYQPAGLLVSAPQAGAALLDGGGEVPARGAACGVAGHRPAVRADRADPAAGPACWVCARKVIPLVFDDVTITPWPVDHTSHPTFGYLIDRAGRRAAWAPEFVAFPGVGGRGWICCSPMRPVGGGRSASHGGSAGTWPH